MVRILGEADTLIYPDGFIEQAELSGMIVPLGREVIRKVCRDLSGWRQRGCRIERVAINLSGQQLSADAMLTGFIEQILRGHGLDHSDLEFELTERHRLSAGDCGADVLRTLHDAGARLAARGSHWTISAPVTHRSNT